MGSTIIGCGIFDLFIMFKVYFALKSFFLGFLLYHLDKHSDLHFL